MENSFVVIGYDQNQKFLDQIQRGPFNQVANFFYVKAEQKKLKAFLTKEEQKCLAPFFLEKYDLDIEDVEGWEDPIFLKGKMDPSLFLDVFTKFKNALPQLLSAEDWEFYQQPLQEFSADLDALLQDNEVAYLTFYDLLV